jgi:peptide/nickel transport system permease protein
MALLRQTDAPGAMLRLRRSDLWHSFTRSRLVVAAAAATLTIVSAAWLAPWIAPHNPFDLASLDLMDARNPPAWLAGGDWKYPLGTDNQGRDILSAVLYGTRISSLISLAAVSLAMLLGITLGLLAGYFGGLVESLIMRAADIQLTFPAILTALLIDGAARAFFGQSRLAGGEYWVLIAAIGLAFWVQYARIVRALTLVEKGKDYVEAARLVGIGPVAILARHILPNVLGPVLVLATINLALAIITEATLSFLGVGLPPSQPSLGTLVRLGSDFLLSGEWWIVFFPGLALGGLALAVNLVGDWLRDALNPKLR